MTTLEWMLVMWLVRRRSRKLLFRARQLFWLDLRPITPDGARIVYPDCIPYLRLADYRRAITGQGKAP